MRQDCDDCANTNCKGFPSKGITDCGMRQLPKSGWSFAELLLEHPQSTHDTLSNLPFEVNLTFLLK